MTRTGLRRTGGGARGRAAALTAVLVAVGTLSGCFGHSTTPEPAGQAGGSASPVVSAPLHVRAGVTRVVGELAPDARKQLGARAGTLVRRYFQAAFVAPKPRSAGGAALFPGFTPGARTLAVRDRAVLTGAGYAGATRVVPGTATAYVSVLAPAGHPVGATVRVSLSLTVTDAGRTWPVLVAGRLLLTPTPGGWRIFGYDLSQSGRHARSAS